MFKAKIGKIMIHYRMKRNLFSILVLLSISQVFAQEQQDEQVYPAKGYHILGTGFQPLTNEVRLPVFKLTYNNKNLNLDHNGLIPDNVVPINHPQVIEEFYSQVIDWKKSSNDIKKFNIDGKAGLFGISGSFSYDNNWIHKQATIRKVK